ncbi:NAC domain-containing protein 83-like [Curcuma longa]|uniref:NAC domain-containing protein 83-like n=1 Tax=Curcuma longa TaxID=136217 RepID=UPI003D9FB148
MATATATAKTVVPIGYRFLPTDEELILDYLANKVAGELVPSTAVVEADVYGTEPWNLLGKDDQEAYFFAVRKRKNAVGTRVDRRAGTGTWTLYSKKEEFVTAVDDDGREIAVGCKSSLSFNDGKKKNSGWIMHEYELYPAGGVFQTQVLCHIKNRAVSGKIKKRSRFLLLPLLCFPECISAPPPPKRACNSPALFLEPSPSSTITCDCDVDQAFCDQVLASLVQSEEENGGNNFTTPDSVGHENALWQWMQLPQGQASDLGSWEELDQILLGEEFDL